MMLAHLLVEPTRRHRCEHCHTIFKCEECTAAMVKANDKEHALYSDDHAPCRGFHSLESKTPWLCEGCK